MSALAIFTLAITIATNVEASNITSPSYAWSESVGWIKFDTGAGDITVSNTEITGYAYNDNIGWILLDGISNDGTGNLSGYAWSESVGYIDFNTVSIENNEFQGYAYNDNIGFISFNCANTDTCGDVDYKVSTTWKQASPRRSGGSSAQARITNLEQSGNQEEADRIREQFNVEPTSEPTVTTPTSLSQLIETLISLGIITGDNIERARTAVQSLEPSTTTQFTRDLELNSEGPDVRALQQYLINAGYSIPAGPTNFFGPQTQSALIQFQQANNISPAAGYFGPITRGVIR